MKGLDVFEKLLRVLADEGFGVVAGDIVPLDPVIVDVVQHSHAGLHGPVNVELRVVRLGDVVGDELGLVSGEGPGLVAPAWRGGVGGSHLDAGARPEPAIDGGRLEVLSVAALEVAESAAAPDVGKIVVSDELLNHLVLAGGLERHQVHAVLPADVPSVQPVNLVVSKVFFISREKVVMTSMLKVFWSCKLIIS